MREPTEGEREERATTSAPETSGPLGTGWLVFLLLAVLTAVEFVLAVTIDANLPILVVIGLAKAGLIVHYFMHLMRLWRSDQEEEA